MAGKLIPGRPGEFLLYQTEDGRTRVEVRVEHETVWLTQKQMAELFQKDVRTVSEHIGNIFEEAELQPDSVVRNFRITAADGKQYDTRHYSLDVIISVGYRVKSLRGTQFRIWATQRLREYIVKGFTMDDERLKASAGGNYFEELLNRIRDIRSSERMFWRPAAEGRCRNRQELPEPGRAARVELDRRGLPRLCRAAGGQPQADEDGRLDREAR